MAKIPIPITPQKFEIIRDRIGSILKLELANQAILLSDGKLNPSVWNSRFIPLDSTELPAVNVTFFQGDYSNKDQLSVDGAYVYTIDIYANSVSPDDSLGDHVSASLCNRIAGLCRAILENPQYKTLDFAPPFLETLGIRRIQSSDSIESIKNQNIDNLTMLRLEFAVRANEDVTGINAPMISGMITGIKLELTNKGYKYELEA